MQYAIETEFGRIYVSKSEFQDVKDRHTGKYGKDWTEFHSEILNKSFPIRWGEKEEDGCIVGSAGNEAYVHEKKFVESLKNGLIKYDELKKRFGKANPELF